MRKASSEISDDTLTELTISKLQADYPQLAPSMLSLLHTVSDNLEGKKNGL